MERLTLRRHMMPASTLLAFVATVLPAGRAALGHLVLGLTLLGSYWLVEWLGITGTYEGRVPRRSLAGARRAVWLAGLVLCVVDFLWLLWTPWRPPGP